MDAHVAPRVLGRRALGRALLARQLLLRRGTLPALDAVEHLVGLQAQAPNPPYVGLWSRLDGFRIEQLSALVESRQLVRIALLRSTIHLVTARDCLRLRPLVQPVLDRGVTTGRHARQLAGVDPVELTAAGRALVEERPRTYGELGTLLSERWPGPDPASLAAAVRTWVPLVQVPPRGMWGMSGQAAHTSAEVWLGRPLDRGADLDELVLRYLAAFGPATIADVQVWSGLTRLREVAERLRPRLLVLHDEQGRELLDLPDAPRPEPDVPAPVRLLAEFDNLTLSHADRTRVIADEHRRRIATKNGMVPGLVLVDGQVRGTWRITRARSIATLTVSPFAPLTAADGEAATAEGADLLRFAAGQAESYDVRVAAPAG